MIGGIRLLFSLNHKKLNFILFLESESLPPSGEDLAGYYVGRLQPDTTMEGLYSSVKQQSQPSAGTENIQLYSPSKTLIKSL